MNPFTSIRRTRAAVPATLVATAATLAAGAISVGPAQGVTTTELASIKSAMHGKCVEAPSEGTALRMSPCGGPGAFMQRWAYDPANGRIRLEDGPACIDATDATWASPVIVRSCGSGQHQQWDLDSRGRFVLRGATISGKPICMTIANGDRADGAKLSGTYCHFGENQKFRLDPSGAPGSSVSVEVDLRAPIATAACIDAPSTAPGTRLKLYMCQALPHPPQRFTRTAARELRMGSVCMAAGSTQGSAATLQTCDGSAAQQWNLNGHGELVGLSDRCAWAHAETNVNGTEISMQPCNGALLGELWSLREFR